MDGIFFLRAGDKQYHELNVTKISLFQAKPRPQSVSIVYKLNIAVN